MDFHRVYPSFGTQEEDPIQRLEYQQTASAAKLEKISHRLTMISILIPVLILALMGFMYMDMRERVISSDSSKQTQMETVSSQMTEKLNSLDTRLAQNRFELDQQLPRLMASIQDLSRKMDSASGNAETMSGRVLALEKGKKVLDKTLSAMKTSMEQSKKQLGTMTARIKKNTGKNTAAMETIERINKELTTAVNDAVANAQKNAQARIQTLDEQIQALKKEIQKDNTLVQTYEKQLMELKRKTARSMEDVKGHIKRVEISVSAIARNLANQSAPPTVPKNTPKAASVSTPPASANTEISAQQLTE